MSPEYAASRKVHAELSRGLKPVLVADGWRKQTGGTCAFTRPCAGGGGQWLLWVQVSQWGSSDLGNDFTLNLDRQADPGIHPGSGPDSRILALLDATDRRIALEIETRIVERKTRPGPDRPIHQFLRQDTTGQLRAAWDRAFAPQPQRWHEGGDPWLAYYSVDDISEWVAFLIERLPGLLQRAAH